VIWCAHSLIHLVALIRILPEARHVLEVLKGRRVGCVPADRLRRGAQGVVVPRGRAGAVPAEEPASCDLAGRALV
jgi:hypothetical protein